MIQTPAWLALSSPPAKVCFGVRVPASGPRSFGVTNFRVHPCQRTSSPRDGEFADRAPPRAPLNLSTRFRHPPPAHPRATVAPRRRPCPRRSAKAPALPPRPRARAAQLALAAARPDGPSRPCEPLTATGWPISIHRRGERPRGGCPRAARGPADRGARLRRAAPRQRRARYIWMWSAHALATLRTPYAPLLAPRSTLRSLKGARGQLHTPPTHPRAHDAATPSLRTAADPIHVCTLCTQTAPTQLTVKMLADVPSPNATVVEMVTTEEGQDMPRDEFMVRGARARACARPGRFCARGCGCPHFARQSPTLPARALRRRCRAFLGLKTLIWMLVPPS